MKHTCLLITLLTTMGGYAQTTTTYYDQNGMPIGKAKTEKTWTPQPYQGSPLQYQSSLPSLDLIERGMAYKQSQTDSRKVAIQSMIDGIATDINRLFRTYPDEGRQLFSDLGALINRLNSVQQDITQDRVYNSMLDMVNQFKGSVYSTYQNMGDDTKPEKTTASIGELLEYKGNNAPTWVGKTIGQVEAHLQGRSVQFRRATTNEGTPFISYGLSNGGEATYYFNQSVCFKYLLGIPPVYKDQVKTSLNRLYSPMLDDGNSGNLSYDGIWLDRANNIRWTLEIQTDVLLIRAKQNPR